MNFRCPVCRVPLQHSRSGGTSQWACGTCLGRAMSIGVLRRLTNRKVVTAFWTDARTAGTPTHRPCPCCEKPMSCVSRALPEGGDGPASLELDACTRCQMFWFDPGEFEGMPVSIPEQVESPGDTTKDLPEAARMALMHARIKSIKEQADLGDDVPEGLVDMVAAMLLLPVETRDGAPGRLGVAWVTALLALGIIVSSFLGGFLRSSDLDVAKLAFDPDAALRMGGATLLTAFFVHGGWLHILGNLYFLKTFGDNVEDILGPARYALLWAVATAASFGVYAFSSVSEGALVAGASGGISAFVVAYALLFPRAKLGILFFWRWLIRFPAWLLGLLWFGLQLLGFGGELMGSSGGVAYLGHLTGGAVGLLAWLVWKDRMR